MNREAAAAIEVLLVAPTATHAEIARSIVTNIARGNVPGVIINY